jgi:4-diphosphocytidyl-2-C-methyl-D-erythritol kinase
MSLTVIEQAYAKVNLCLFLGPTRADGRHEILTLFDSLRLTDELIVRELPASSAGAGVGTVDEVVCDGVSGPNLVADALAGLRASGWAAAAVRVEIWKRIPVAAGMGGGSADAAAMLRCARRLAPVDPAAIARIAASLGADVPGQLRPGVSLGTGAGELIEPLAKHEPYGVLVLPQPFPLSTPEVYREADRLGLGRGADELAALHARLSDALGSGSEPPQGSNADHPRVLPAELAVNDLQAAAVSLRPELAGVLQDATEAGADRAMVCGSGPTVIGLYHGPGAGDRARAAAADPRLRARHPRVTAAAPVHSAQSGVHP